MHIAIVIERFDPDAGGNERSTAQIAQQLCENGHEVTILTGSSGRDACLEGVTIRAMAEKKSSSVLRLVRFARWARRHLDMGKFDVSMSVTMAVAADVLQPRGGTIRETLERNIAMRVTPGARAGKRLSIALAPKQRVLLEMEKRTLSDPRVRRIVAVSRYVVEQLGVHYGFPEERTTLIHNASVMPRADAERRAGWRDKIRRGFRIPDHATVFLFAAQNPRLKGFGTLIHALHSLVEQGLDSVVFLAGLYGYSHQEWIAQMGLRSRVRIVGQTRQMHGLFAAADVTVLPSYYDPSSKVVIESLMMGTPAISTVFNGASDFIQPEGSAARGRVIQNPGDPTELAQAMAELHDSSARQACIDAIGDGLAGELSMARHVDRLERVLADAARA